MDDVRDIDINAHIERAERVIPYVVDADAHVNPPPTIWQEYLSPKFRHQAPTMESDGEFDYVVFEGTRRKMNLMGGQAGRTSAQYKAAGRLSDMRLGGWMAPQRLEDMDRDGVDQAIIYGGGPLATADIQLYVESFAAYNRWIKDFCSQDPRRLHHVGYVPMLDVDTAVTMLDEAAKSGAVAINLPAFPQAEASFSKGAAQSLALTGDSSGTRQYRDAEFDQIWSKACDLDLALTYHLGARVSRFADKNCFLPDLPMARIAMLEVMGILIYGGVFDRFPALRVGSIESGVGWIPWATEFMDRSWEMQRHWTNCTIKHPPSHYFEKNIYASFVSDPVAVQLRDRAGGRNVMWSSDYPHAETTFPHSQATIAREFAGVPAADRDWIVAGCARKFYRL